MKHIVKQFLPRVLAIGFLFLTCAALGLSPPESRASVTEERLTPFRSFDDPDYYGVAKAARGTHLTRGNGVVTLTIPGEPVAAYLYIAGHDHPRLPGPHFPVGDQDVEVRVIHNPWTKIARRTIYTTVPVVRWGGTSYLNRLDISEAVGQGANRITVSRYNLNVPEGIVAIAIYRTAAPGAVLKTVQILDGVDEGYYPRVPPLGPDSELVTFTFTPTPCAERKANLLLGIGGTERGRGDEIFLFTGAGDPASVLPDTDGDGLPDIVDRTHKLTRRDARPPGNDPADRFGNLEAVAGAVSLEEDGLGTAGCTCYGDEMDLFSTEYTVPAESGFSAFQVQSENPENGDSFTLYFAVNELPYVECPNPVPEIQVTKAVSPTEMPEPGGVATFTVTVWNPVTPGVPQEDVDLESLIDDRFGDITAVHDRISRTDCQVRRIGIGDSLTCTFDAEVSGRAATPHRDIVTAYGRGAISGAPVWDSDDAVVTFTPVLGALGDFVWEDADRDGVQDAGEAGLAGVRVELWDRSSGALVAQTLTDAGGIYGFANLPAGEYRVTVVPPLCMLRTWDLDGIGSPDTAAVTLGIGETRTDVDFGYAPPRAAVALVKTVSPAEAYPGDLVTYNLLVTNTGETTLFNVVVTDPMLNRLPPHTIGTVAELLPGGTATFQVPGFTVPTCSDARTLPGACADGSSTCAPPPNVAALRAPSGPSCIPPTICHLSNTATVTGFACAGPVTDSDDACLTILPLKRVGDLVWLDADGNGVRDVGEPGIANVVLTLRRPNGSTTTTKTDGAGAYSFWDLRDGAYTVTPAAPATAPQLTTPPSPRGITLGKCQLTDLTADFGFRAPAP